MSVNVENTPDAATAPDWDTIEEPIHGVSADLIHEKIKANLEPLIEQISTLTQLLNQLIQEISARDYHMAVPRTHQTHSRLSTRAEVENL